MNYNWKKAIASLLVLALVATLCLSCGTEKEKGKVVITIGEITDLTGAGAPGMLTMHFGMQDVIRYFNDEGIIPGVKLKTVVYNTGSDAARDALGYEWLRGRGANPIVCVSHTSAEMMKSFAERDKVTVLSGSTTVPLIEPPGWVFCLSATSSWGMNTLLKWISEEHWDYSQRIPKIGWAAWNEPAGHDIMEAMKAYCQDHPDKFEWVGGFPTPLGTLTFSGEEERLKHCDYVGSFLTPLGYMLRDFRAKGYDATFIDVNSATYWKGLLVDLCGWEALDGTLCAVACPYWTHPFPMVDLAKELLDRYRHGEAEDIIYSGASYAGIVHAIYAVLDIMHLAIDEVGAENYNAQAFYNAAIKYKTTGPIWQGYPSDWGYSETRRNFADDFVIYEFDAERQDLVAITDWLPAIK